MFEYRDSDGARLRVDNVTASTYYGNEPVVALLTEHRDGDDMPVVYVPLDRVEEVIAGIRDAARTASGQQTERDCPSCDVGIEHTEHCPTHETHNWGCGCPTDQMPGSRLAEAVAILHEAMDHGVKDPVARQRLIGQLVGACHHAAELRAAVGQPAEAHDTEVLRIRDRWYVEYFYGQGTNAWWGVAQGPHITREQALAEKETRRDEPADRRVVRETTTWTVENER